MSSPEKEFRLQSLIFRWTAVTEDRAMAKERSAVADFTVYALVRIVICIVQALPWRMAVSVAGGLAWLAYRIDRRHREAALDNLRHAFPETTPAQRDRMV